MDKLTATKVYENELREMEFERIEKIIEGYKIPYKPGIIFSFDLDYNTNHYIVTFQTEYRIYYRQLYAQIYHPTWESTQLSQNFINKSIYIKGIRTKYVFKYNGSLMNEYAKDSLTIDEFYNNTICFRSSEIYSIIYDNHLDSLYLLENNVEL